MKNKIEGILTALCLTWMHRRGVGLKPLGAVILFILAATQLSFAQPSFRLAFGGQSGTLDEFVQTVALDGSNNIYVAGSFEGTVDFDPSAATFNLTATGSFDAFMAKYTSTGVLTWAKKIGGSGIDEIYAITTDAGGNVYVTGYFEGTADFDPDAGVVNLASAGFFDMFFCKYTSGGVYTWANRIGSSTDDDFGVAIALDASANVYVGGTFTGTADFDPTAGINNRTSVGGEDAFFAKYTTGGLYNWANAIGSTGNDGCRALATGSTFVWFGGYYNGTTNIDPAGVVTNAANLGGFDGLFARYNQSDGKLNSNWGTIRSATNDVVTAILTDGTNLWTAGYFTGTATMYGFSAASSKTSAGDTDAFVAMHDASMNLAWFNTMGAAGTDGVNLITRDASNIYATGYFENTVDFDPSAANNTWTSAGGYDAFVTKYNSTSGALISAGASGSIGDDQGTSIATNLSSELFVAEIFSDVMNVDWRGGVHLLTPAGGVDWLLAKYEQLSMGTEPVGPPSAFASSAVTTASATISWTPAPGPPAGYIVTRKAGAAPINTPIDANNYAAGQFIDDFVVAYVGTASTFGDAGLAPNTTYEYRVYPYNGSAGTYNYLTGSPLAGTVTTTGVPVITSLTPGAGAVGSVITIVGTGFDATIANNVVYFGAAKATVTAASTTSLTVVVPNGGTYLPVSVTNAAGFTGYSPAPFVTTIAGATALGATSFATQVQFGAGSLNYPDGVVAADFDLDGKADLAVGDGNSFSIDIHRNISTTGSISFVSAGALTTGTSPMAPVAADLDGDGKLDLLTVNPTSANLSLFRNASLVGNISFATKIDLAALSPRLVAIDEIDGDGKPDLVVTNISNSNMSVYRNTSTIGSISVAPAVNFATATSPYGVAIGDIDGDGKKDVVVANTGSSSISVLRNTSTAGSIQFVKVDISTPFASTLSLADFDGDGKLDVVVTGGSGTLVQLLRNTSTVGSVSMVATLTLTAGSTAAGVSVDDIDGDGKVDIMVTNNTSNNCSVFKNNSTSGTHSFSAKFDFATGGAPHITNAIVDLDGDQRKDLVICNSTSNTFSVLRNVITIQPPTITSFGPASGPAGTLVTITGTNFDPVSSTNIVYFGSTRAVVSASSATSLTVAVPDGGMYRPISVTNSSALTAYSRQPFVTTITGASALSASAFLTKQDFTPGFNQAEGVVAGDFDNDGKPDLAIANRNANAILVQRNTSTPGVLSFGTAQSFTTATEPTHPVAADLDNDGKIDLLTVNGIGASLSLFRNTSSAGSISFATKQDIATAGASASVAAVEDLDGDGKPEIVATINASNQLRVFTNAGSPGVLSFTPITNYPTPAGPIGVAIGDIDGDGKKDIVTANVSAGSISVYRNTSSPGLVSFATNVDAGAFNPWMVALADLDGDGKLDIAVTSITTAGVVSVFRNTSTPGAISLATKIDLTAGNNTAAVSIDDLDGDGKVDIVATNHLGDNMSVFKNNSTSGVFSFATKFDFVTGTRPTHVISIVDIDGDRKKDVVVANAISNSYSVFRNNISVAISEPTTQPTAFVATPTSGSIAVSFTAAAPFVDGYIVLGSISVPSTDPVDGTSYTAGNGLGNAVVVGIGAGTSYNYAGLFGSTLYNFKIYSYNGTGATINYRQLSPLTGSSTTLSGGLSAEPSASPTAFVATPAATSISVSFTAASPAPAGYLVLRGSAVPNTDPVDGTAYTAGAVLGNAVVVASGTGTSFNDTGLTSSTTYNYKIYSYNGSGTSINYLQTGPLTSSATTTSGATPEPTASPTVFSATPAATSISVSFTAATGAPAGYIALRGTAVPSTDPVDGTAYTVGGVLGNAVVVATGISTTFNDTGLTSSTAYNYKIYSFNGSGSSINYRQTSPLTGTSTTTASLAAEPTAQPTAFVLGAVSSSTIAASFTAAAGPPTGYIAIRGAAGGAAPTFTPVDGTAYTAGQAVGTGNTVAYAGSVTSFTDSGLTASTTYSYRIYSFNGTTAATINYLTSVAGLSGTGATNNSVLSAFAEVISPSGSDFYSIRFLDASTAVAVGSGGTILRTVNGGTTWSTVTNPGTGIIYGTFFNSTTNGFAAGENGQLMRTTNGGLNWSVVSTPTSDDLYAIHMVPATLVGFVVGADGAVLKTTDGGTTWTELINAAALTGTYYNTVFFKDVNTGFIAGPDGVVKTTNGGSSWVSFSSDPILWYDFPSATVGYGVGDEGKIIKTTDGGTNWTTQTSGVTVPLWGTYFADVSTGFAVGEEGVVLKTSNGGTTWTAATDAAGIGTRLYAVHFGSASNGIIVGSGGFIGKAAAEPGSAIVLTQSFKSEIDANGATTVTVTVPTLDLPRVTGVEFHIIGITKEAQGLVETVSAVTNPVGGVYTKEIQDTGNEKVGHKYYFVVNYDDQFNRTAITPNGYAYIKYSGANELKLVNLRSGTTQSAYELISIPLLLTNNSVTQIFEDLSPTYDRSVYRLYKSTPTAAGTNYTEMSSGALTPGQGYWLIMKDSKTINLEGKTVEATVDSPFKLTLAQGFNLIGNPYNFQVPWNAGTIVGDLRTWTGTIWTEASALDPFKGYFVDVETAGQYPVPLDGPFDSGRTKEFKFEQNETSWKLDINLEQGEYGNELAKIGMHPEATLGMDVVDARVFPMPGFMKLASVSIDRPEAGVPLEKDIVPTGNNETWEFTLRSEENSLVTISWDRELIATIGRELYLFDEEQILLIDMRSIGKHQANTNTRLKIITGDPSYVKSEVSFSTSAVGNIYPNPAVDGFFVPVAMSRAGEVRVRVFDLQGKEVVTQVHFAGEGLQNINIAGLPGDMNGLYLVTTETLDSGRKVQKVIFK